MSGLNSTESLLDDLCGCGHPQSYHDGNGCHAPAGVALEYDCGCRVFVKPLTWWEVLIRRAEIEPIGADISDFSDDYCAGFLAGQASILEEIESGRLAIPKHHPPPCYICGAEIKDGEEFWFRDGHTWCHKHQPVWSRP